MALRHQTFCRQRSKFGLTLSRCCLQLLICKPCTSHCKAQKLTIIFQHTSALIFNKKIEASSKSNNITSNINLKRMNRNSGKNQLIIKSTLQDHGVHGEPVSNGESLRFKTLTLKTRGCRNDVIHFSITWTPKQY